MMNSYKMTERTLHLNMIKKAHSMGEVCPMECVFLLYNNVPEVLCLMPSTEKKPRTDSSEGFTEQAENRKKKQKKHRSPMTPVQILLLNLLIVITVLWLLFGFVIGVAIAPNNDMSPSIKAKDLLLYYRLDKSYLAQDTVVFVKNDTTYIGRVVAVSGDSVDISDDDRLIINGHIVSEPEIRNATPRYEGFVTYPVQLGDNEYFVLADARSGAEDSRYFGTVERSEIYGKAFLLIRRNSI